MSYPLPTIAARLSRGPRARKITLQPRTSDVTRRYKRLIALAVLALVLGGGAWYLTRPEPVAVTVATVARGAVERTVANTRAGTVEACRRAKLSPSMGGQIARLDVHEGDHVEAGQLLLELWNQDLRAQVELAGSEARASAASAEAVCAQAEVAGREAARLQKLRTQGLASEEQTDRASTEAKAGAAQCRAAKAQAQVSASRLKVAQANLERTQLYAPFAGVVAEITGELNEYTTPSPPGIPTPPAIDLIDNTCFYVTAPIDEVDVAEVRVDMPARISLDAYGNRHFDGRVRRVSSYVLDLEKQARTVDVEAEFADPKDIANLLAGYSADVEVILEVRADTVYVPTEAVIDGQRVLRRNADTGVLEDREVRIGIANWDRTEVLEGLAAGDQVVVSLDRKGVEAGARTVLDAGTP